jgi:hypothetical protein
MAVRKRKNKSSQCRPCQNQVLRSMMFFGKGYKEFCTTSEPPDAQSLRHEPFRRMSLRTCVVKSFSCCVLDIFFLEV